MNFDMRFLLLPLLSALLFGAPPQPDAHATIVILENDWLAHQSDRTTLERILAPDFIHPVAAGVFLTRQQHIAWAVEHPRPGRKFVFEKLDVRLYGETAIATGIVANSDAAGGDLRRTIFTDVFVLRRGRWQAIGAQETPIN